MSYPSEFKRRTVAILLLGFVLAASTDIPAPSGGLDNVAVASAGRRARRRIHRQNNTPSSPTPDRHAGARPSDAAGSQGHTGPRPIHNSPDAARDRLRGLLKEALPDIQTSREEGPLGKIRSILKWDREEVTITSFANDCPVHRLVESNGDGVRATVVEAGSDNSVRGAVWVVSASEYRRLELAGTETKPADTGEKSGRESDVPNASAALRARTIECFQEFNRAIDATNATDWNQASFSIASLQYECGYQFRALDALQEIFTTIEVGRELSDFKKKVEAENHTSLIESIATQFGAGVRDAAATHDRLGELAKAVQGPSEEPPDAAVVKNRLDALRERPELKRFADRLQLGLAARTFLDGHSQQARELLRTQTAFQPESEYAAALLKDFTRALRDMQVAAVEPGAFTTWPLQDASATAAIQRGSGPRGLLLLLPDAPEGIPIHLLEKPVLPTLRVPPELAHKLDEARADLLSETTKYSFVLRDRLRVQAQKLPAPSEALDAEEEELVDELESQLAMAAGIVEEFALANLHDIPSLYPTIVAFFLRSALTKPERVIVRESQRAGASVELIVDRLARGRLDSAAQLAPRIADALDYRSSARLAEISSQLPALIDGLPDPFVIRLAETVHSDQATTANNTNGGFSTEYRGNDGYLSEIEINRLLETLKDPKLEADRSGIVEEFHDMVASIQNAIGGDDERLVDLDHWTTPLLSLITDHRRGATRAAPATKE
jgi:hypothetical protein